MVHFEEVKEGIALGRFFFFLMTFKNLFNSMFSMIPSGLQTGPGIKKPTLVITDLYDQTGHFWAPSHTPIDSHKPLWDKGRRGSFALLPSETHLLEGYFPTL